MSSVFVFNKSFCIVLFHCLIGRSRYHVHDGPAYEAQENRDHRQVTERDQQGRQQVH